MARIEALAPAKVNLTLHVTGRRVDGYHLLDSLVAFADLGDRVALCDSDATTLRVTGPMAQGVPVGRGNLVLRAAEVMGATADITLEKHLPSAGGIGGGSSDAAATLRALSRLGGQALPADAGLSLGADLPVCLAAPGPARMTGIGEGVTRLPGLPVLHAVLVNPGCAVPTGAVFACLETPDNPAMPNPIPQGLAAPELIAWLGDMRNDLQVPAIAVEPAIAHVLEALARCAGCGLARMSGSGATCFGLFISGAQARAAAARLSAEQPGWWVAPVRLNALADDQLMQVS